MKLYDAGPAPNPRRVRIFLAEKGITVPLVPVDLAKGEHRSDAYTALNPFQRTPTLELDDGTAITESIAICRYFEELQPDPPLFGTGALGRAQVEMWQRRLELEFYAAVQAVFRHTHPAMAAMEVPQLPDWAAANRPRVEAFLRLLDRHLADRPFVCGDAFTVADITGLVTLDFMRWARLAVPDDLAAVRGWHERLKARPSAQA